MPAKPPPLPEAVYQRVMRVAKAEGWSILIIASMGAFMAAGGGNVIPAIAACVAAGAGAMEIHGVQRLARGDETAVNWLVRSQLLLMLVILAYVIFRLVFFDLAAVQPQLLEVRREMLAFYENMNVDAPSFYQSDAQFMSVVRLVYTLTYCLLGIATCVYQGLMARYYHRRRAAISQALNQQDA